MGRLIVVTDFDGTLMQQDVGDTIMEALGIVDTPELQEVNRRFHAKEVGSREWILTGYGMVSGRQAEVDAVIERITPRQGAAEFLRFCQDQSIPVTVLSDGMEYYIRRIMSKFDMKADRIISNPIFFNGKGEYSLGLQNQNKACSWCGCCKADVVRSMKASGEQVVYIGDGVSDMYGSVFADIIFARASLARYLEKAGMPFYRFETFHDVLRVLKPMLDDGEWQNGVQPNQGDEGGGHPFCRFA